jgi:energy-coupling factor transporter ATP-binding protein EcfA2
LSPPRPFVVELAGLPGSGKTTLADALSRLAAAEGVACSVVDKGVSARSPRLTRVARRAGYGLRAVLNDPYRAGLGLHLMATSRQHSSRDAVALGAQWLATGHLIDKAHGCPGLYLLEEGALQTVWSAALRAGGLRPEALWRALPAPSRSDLVLLLDISPQLAVERLNARPSQHSRSQAIAPDQRLAELIRGGRLLDSLAAGCPLPVHRVAVQDEPPATLAERCLAALLHRDPDLL